MDFDLKQWRDHKPKLPSASSSSFSSSALPLFLSEPNRTMSAFPSDHSTCRIPRMESYFSSSQWQELELQALIFRHMSAGADVPLELLHLLKKSLISSPFYHYYPHLHPSLVQSGYWGRGAMDPEPGRCRRTDGKKWRCSRDVVAAQKYCERHMHRGKNRSRKPVEFPTSAASPYGGEPFKSTNSLTRQGAAAVGAGAGAGGPPHFTFSVPSHSTDLLHLNQRALPDSIMRDKGPFDARNDGHHGGRTLRFFDDWPKPLHETDNAPATSSVASPTSLSILMPENPTSDFSLKLGTGNGGEPSENGQRDKPELNLGVTWEAHPVAPMGGPLAEVLRSSASHSSPTSVLHRPPRAPASEASY